MDSGELADRIKPPHLTEEELKSRVESIATIVPEPPAAETPDVDPRAEREYKFKLNFKDARGKLWSGNFTTKVLSISERQRVGILRAQLNGSLPLEALDALTSELNLIVAHMTYSLTDKPDWAKSLMEIEQFAVVQAVYDEVASHEAYFLGWDTNPQKSGD